MIWMLLFLGCLCAAGLAAAVLLQRRFEQTVGLVLLAAGFAAYLLALAGLLPAAAYLIPAAGAASVVFLGYHFFKTKKVTLRSLTPGFWVFLLCCAICWWTVRGRLFIKWDEFSHWGLVVKDMYYTGQLYTRAGSVAFPDYPPFMPLLEYLLVAFSPVYREDFVLFAVNLLTLSLVIYPLGAISRRKVLGVWLNTFLGGMVLALIPVSFIWRHYIQVTIDGPMGLFMAFACLAALLEPDRRLMAWMSGLSLAALALSKGAGFPLAMLCGIVIVAAQWIRPKKGRMAAQLTVQLLPLCIPLAAWGSWQIHLKVLQITSKWSQSGFSLQALMQLIRDGEPAYRVEVWNAYIQQLFVSKIYGVLPISCAGVLGLMILGGLLLVVLCPAERRRPVAVTVFGLAVTVVVFAVSLLYSYMFVFDPVEAVQLASLTRYLGTPLTASLLVVVSLLLVEPREKSLPWAILTAAVLTAQLTTPHAVKMLNITVNASADAAQTHHERYLYQQAAAAIHTVSDGSDVYVIAPQDNGNAVNYISYEMAPAALPEQSSGIGCLYPEEWYNGYTIYCTPEQWSRVLYDGPFRYVYLFQVDGYFATGYHTLFEDEAYLVNGSLLEVVRREDGVVTLRGIILGENT